MEPVSTATLLLVLDLLGIAVFAASGALTGVQKQLDIFGVVFLAGATGLGGGFIRDALIGATPAAALGDWRYLAVPAFVGAVPLTEEEKRFIIGPAFQHTMPVLLRARGLDENLTDGLITEYRRI